MTKRFDDKVVLITGGSSGMGRDAAVAFGREGAKVVIAARRLPESEETAQMVRDAGGKATVAQADVSVEADVEAMVKHALDTFGRLDIAFNNAGVGGGGGDIHEVDQADWNQIFNINLKGLWLCMKYEVPQMIEGGGGSIVNNLSDAGLMGWAGNAVYTASKWGGVGLTKSAALQYIKRGIRINAVCPGYINTPMLGEEFTIDELNEAMKDGIPAGRIGQPSEITDAVLWLCSDASSYVVGHMLAVEGGSSAGMM